jgi:two-component system NtrC family sensor kinase
MNAPEPPLRFSFQIKVLVPVLTALVLLPTITLWIVNRSMSQQVQVEARQTLDTAEAVFLNFLDIRSRSLAARFRNTVNEPRFKATAQLGDPKTLKNYLRDLLDEMRDETELIGFTTDRGVQLASAQRDSGSLPGDLAPAAPIIQQALGGVLSTGIISHNSRTYNVVSVPVQLSENGPLIGALTIATRLSESTMQELKSLTHADIFLLAGSAVTASTIRQPALPDILPGGLAGNDRQTLPVEIQGEHYFALTDNYQRGGTQRSFRYVLLSSYEPQLRELERTRTTLLTVSIAGILLSGLVVWFLIRRITHPLEELRDNAEAVGRGDFTRRITRFSNDECGAVAVAFNDMTANLQVSRADLEKAVGSLKTAQAQLIQSEKLSAVGQFVAGVAHELNNPLTSVIGFAELLQQKALAPEHQNYVDRIARSAARCHKIVNNLLSFSRQHEPERKPILLNDLVDAVIEIIAYDLRSSNITLVKEYQSGLPAILGDSHQLQQVVLNILSNARQAMEAFRRDGQIVLRTGCTDTHVWLRIKDNGPGMPREILTRIFDPFFTTKPQGKGTGLGLSLSYGIMQEHRGRIHAESEPGHGTEFILELPIAEPTVASPVIRPDSAPPLRPNQPSLHVLVIDDEESILQLVQEVLRGEGHRVETTTSGLEALELIGRNRYDVIISDWKMPGLDGINLFKELLVKDPVAANRMLFMTGDVIKESFQEFLGKNSRICLPKPFSLREFRSAVSRIINAR